MTRKKLTVYDYLKTKGKRQISVMFVHNVEEAAAAEEAGIDMICTAHDAPKFGIYTHFQVLRLYAHFGEDFKQFQKCLKFLKFGHQITFPCLKVRNKIPFCDSEIPIRVGPLCI